MFCRLPSWTFVYFLTKYSACKLPMCIRHLCPLSYSSLPLAVQRNSQPESPNFDQDYSFKPQHKFLLCVFLYFSFFLSNPGRRVESDMQSVVICLSSVPYLVVFFRFNPRTAAFPRCHPVLLRWRKGTHVNLRREDLTAHSPSFRNFVCTVLTRYQNIGHSMR